MEEKQDSIEACGILKSIWESAMAPNFSDRKHETKEWIEDMFKFSMDLLESRRKDQQAAHPSMPAVPLTPPVSPTWPHPAETAPMPSPYPQAGGKRISQAQSKRFYAIARSKNYTNEAIGAWLKQNGVMSGRSEDIPADKYNQFCGAFGA